MSIHPDNFSIPFSGMQCLRGLVTMILYLRIVSIDVSLKQQQHGYLEDVLQATMVLSCRDAVNWQWVEGMEAEASGNYEAAAEAYKTSLRGETPTKRLTFTFGQSCHLW